MRVSIKEPKSCSSCGGSTAGFYCQACRQVVGMCCAREVGPAKVICKFCILTHEDVFIDWEMEEIKCLNPKSRLPQEGPEN